MALRSNTDKAWQKWGEQNPYYGVLTHSKYLNANLNDDSLREFFASGELHVEHVLETIRATVQPNFQPKRVLDYGCGVGRLVIPFAAHAKTVVGVDVSPKMLELARENCVKFGVTSAQMLHLDEMESLEQGSFDLIHSYIVFQHIPVVRGECILRKLIGLIAESGVGALQFTYGDTSSALWSVLRRSVKAVGQHAGFVQGLLNLIRHKPFSLPPMQMNSYSMNRIFDILINAHCSNLHVDFRIMVVIVV